MVKVENCALGEVRGSTCVMTARLVFKKVSREHSRERIFAAHGGGGSG